MREFRKDKKNDRQGSRRFDRDSDRFGRGRSSGGFNRRSGRRDEKTMHQVTCDGCGKDCEVPFKPTEGKPVYCNDCFKSRGKSNKTNQQCNCKEEIEKINQKIDLILEIVKGIKTSQDVKQVAETQDTQNESVSEKETVLSEKPKTKKVAVKKKTTKKKTVKKKK